MIGEQGEVRRSEKNERQGDEALDTGLQRRGLADAIPDVHGNAEEDEIDDRREQARRGVDHDVPVEVARVGRLERDHERDEQLEGRDAE